MAMRSLALVVLLSALSAPAMAASFDCARAATVTERAICADAAVSRLDERALASFGEAVETLGNGADDDPIGEQLLRAHQDWSAARTRCGAVTNCLLQQYLRRIAVLSYRPDAQTPSPLDPLVGRYGTSVEPARALVIMAALGGTVLVNVRVSVGCGFSGVGRSDGAGGLRVERVEAKGANQGTHVLRLTPTRLGLAVRHADARDDVSARSCGAGTSLEHPFPRRAAP